MTIFREVTAAATGAAGIVAALIASAPAMADPGMPNPQPAVAPAPGAPAPQAVLLPQSASAPDADGPPAPTALPTPPNGMQHLSSPQNLPPGTTDVAPDDPTSSGPLGYLRDIWNAYQTQEVDGRGALLMLTQRPMDANAAPPPGMPANPTPPQPLAPGPPPPGPAPTP